MEVSSKAVDIERGPGLLKRISAALFAGDWSSPGFHEVPRALASMLGLAGPIAVGSLTGQIGAGLVMSLGGLAMSSGGQGRTFREQAPGLAYTLAAGILAMLAGSIIAGSRLPTILVIPVLAATAGMVGGLSRPMVRATTQFILYTIIAANLGTHAGHPGAMMVLFALGGIWTAGLLLILRPLLGAIHPALAPGPRDDAAPPRKYPARFLIRRWWKSLAHLAGWQYVLRLTPCLVAAEAYALLWPGHHGYWAAITVAIVVHRSLQAAWSRTLHRAVGTALGVLLAGLLLVGSPSMWTVIVMIGALAAARPMLLDTNYTAYATVQTPLVILLLDFGQNGSWMVATDRLLATLAGCFIALALGYVLWFRLTAVQPPTSRS